jgi:hypothetical protein
MTLRGVASALPRRVCFPTGSFAPSSFKSFICNEFYVVRPLLFPNPKEKQFMNSLINLSALVTATLLAVFAALGLDWLLLRAVFHLMRPAAVRPLATGINLAHGTRKVARALITNR